MSVDVDAVPATIEKIEFNETDPMLMWSETGVKKATIAGRYLSGAKATIVDKHDKSGKTVEGIPYTFVVPDTPLVSPAIQKIDRAGNILTITGQRFFTTADKPLAVTLDTSWRQVQSARAGRWSGSGYAKRRVGRRLCPAPIAGLRRRGADTTQVGESDLWTT
jgi:hypothetical protein